MKHRKRYLAALLCAGLLLCLAGCSTEPAEESTAAPATEPTIAAADALALYGSASEAVQNATDLILDVDLSTSRLVGGETYTEKVAGSIAYSGLGTEYMTSQISEDLAFGPYEDRYNEFYLDGVAYCHVSGYTFSTAMTADSFVARQTPAVLLDPALYATVTAAQTGGNTVITFSAPTALEGWAADSEYAQLVSASGSATLDAAGTLLSTSYQAEYTCGPAAYTLSVTVNVSMDAPPSQPAAPENATPLSCFDAPRIILQVVGDVYTSQAMTVSYTDILYSQAFSAIRSQAISFDTYGSGSDFMAKTSYEVNVTDYTNTATTNSQVVIFRDGRCTNSVNGGEPVNNTTLTAEQMRQDCEDAILASLFTPNHLAEAEMTDTGDFLCITFTGNDAFAENLCDNIYSVFKADLDSYAASYTTPSAGGYLSINKHTGLPTALGVHLSRNHVIDNVSYSLTYQLDQTMQLSSPTAYETITGEAPVETAPAETATPLFYQVTGQNGETMWLLGTIHLGDERTGFLPQPIYDAFHASASLAVEFNINTFDAQVQADPELMTQLASAYYYTDGTTLANHLDAQLLEQIRSLILASGHNNTSAQYYRTVIWWNLLGNFYLRQDYSLSADKGVDHRLLDLAQAQGKPILEIETGLSQIQMLAAFSDPLQTMLLQQIIETGALAYNRDNRELYELWCQGDEAALTAAITDDTTGFTAEELALYEEYNKAMSTDRNARMLAAAKGYLESGETVFCAVGLAHLLGDDGLVAQLRAAGYTVEEVAY